MIQMTITMYSDKLKRHTDVYVAFPPDPITANEKTSPYYQRPIKTMFLLHGFAGCAREFMLTANVQNLAVKYNMAMVCASGENSFYLNQEDTGKAYGDFFGIELPGFLRRKLGLAQSREDTLIGGFSMGGFGALHVGLSHPEQFGSIAAVSAGLPISRVANMKPGYSDVANYEFYTHIFGDPATVIESTKNPETLIKNLIKNGKPIPALYMASGTEDHLLESSSDFVRFLQENGVPVKFDVGPGGHNREFAVPHLETGIRYLLG